MSGRTLALMLLAHFLADFVLQTSGRTSMADLKQRSWWDRELDGVPERKRRMYRNDWAAGMMCHALFWAVAVCLPFAWSVSGRVLLNAIVMNCGIHALVDDMKCNEFRLNLWQDQLIHLAQILVTWVTLGVMSC